MLVFNHRVIAPLVNEYLRLFPSVAVTGPRQSGKSTLLQHILPEYQYVNFDHPEKRDDFQYDPVKFMSQHQNHVIFDEAQKVPELFDYIKIAIDEDRDQYGKFVLTGSSQFMLMKSITESLAGRLGLLTLLPYACEEMSSDLRGDAIFRGSYPELVNRNFLGSRRWYSAYIDTYLTKDVRDLIKIIDLNDFQRLIKLLAARASQVLDYTNLSNDLGVSVQTVKRWVSVLEASYVIFLLPPFYNNFGKRIIKTPKVYFYDTGLVAHLTNVDSRDDYENGPMTGALFENYIVSEIIKKEANHGTEAKLYFLKTNHGVEVDLIIDRGKTQDFIEIKHTHTFKSRMLEPMRKLKLEDQKGYFVYQGKSLERKEDSIEVMHFEDYLLSKSD